jgi:hypothetical protein
MNRDLPENRNSRLWRKLAISRSGDLTATWKAQNVGRDTLKHYGRDIAEALGLADPKSYTAHCWRRSAATLAANAGLSLAQIKALTGHRSDTVVQRYIDRSLSMMLAAAEGTSIGKSSSSRSSFHPSSTCQLAPRPSRSAFEPNSGTGDVHGTLDLFHEDRQ